MAFHAYLYGNPDLDKFLNGMNDNIKELNIKVPAPPSDAGTYKLTCTVSSVGTLVYTWESDT